MAVIVVDGNSDGLTWGAIPISAQRVWRNAMKILIYHKWSRTGCDSVTSRKRTSTAKWTATVGDRVTNDRWWQGDQWKMVTGWPMTVGDRVTNNRWWQDDQWQMARDVDWKQDAEGKESNQYRSTGFEPRISKIRNTLINWTDKTGSTVRSGRGLLG